jgi:hypothetical protein
MFDHKSHLVSLDCSKQLRFAGSIVSGSVKFNTILAKEKGVTALKVSIKAWVHTYCSTFHFFLNVANPVLAGSKRMTEIRQTNIGQVNLFSK